MYIKSNMIWDALYELKYIRYKVLINYLISAIQRGPPDPSADQRCVEGGERAVARCPARDVPRSQRDESWSGLYIVVYISYHCSTHSLHCLRFNPLQYALFTFKPHIAGQLFKLFTLHPITVRNFTLFTFYPIFTLFKF